MDAGWSLVRSEARASTGLSYVLQSQSAQRESNPRFRHGKAAGYLYIMGACVAAELSKTKSTDPGLARGVAALRVRNLRR